MKLFKLECNKPQKNGSSLPLQILSLVKRLTLGDVYDVVMNIENITKDVSDCEPENYVYRITLLSAQNEISYVDGNIDEVYSALKVVVADLRKLEMNSTIFADWILKGMAADILSHDALDDLDLPEIANELCEGLDQLDLDINFDDISNLVSIELEKFKVFALAAMKTKFVFLDENKIEEFSSATEIVDFFTKNKNVGMPASIYVTNDQLNIKNSTAAFRQISQILTDNFGPTAVKRQKKVDKAFIVASIEDALASALNYVRS
jgi:hypothetical protein